MNMNRKLIPYIAILIFTAVTAVVRIILIADSWTWQWHLTVFIVQFAVICGLWLFVKELSNYLDKRLPKDFSVVKKMFLQIAISLVAMTPLYLLLISNLGKIFPFFINEGFVAVISVIFFLVIVVLNVAYRAVYFFREWRKSVEEKAQLQVRAANLEKEKSEMHYHHLKNQVNPHFLFNTFTSLDGLIQTNPQLASQFVRHLSKVYRYVLEHKENEIVTMQAEMEFIKHYVSILKTRYDAGLDISIHLSEAAMEKSIVMITMQMLIDNAIKHNIVQASSPLKIKIWDNDGSLHVQNNKQLRKQIETSNGEGLEQLQQLYAFITDKKITINNTSDSFQINIPLL